MHWNHILMLAAMVSLLTGCANTSQIDLQDPMKVELAEPGSSPGSVTIRSGQMIVLDKTYCPPVQLRDANGVVVRKLIGHTRPQELVVPPRSVYHRWACPSRRRVDPQNCGDK